MHVDALNQARYLRAMSAMLREESEFSMLTNEAIEVHLASLHKGQDELREDVRELRADNKSLRDKLDTVSESLSARIDSKVDAIDTSLNEKIDRVQNSLSGKIAKLSEDIGAMRGMQKAMLWVMSGLGSLGIAGKIFHWF